jgi:type I restriction enzyme, S subunit
VERELPEGWKWMRLEDITLKIETINPENFPDKEFVYLDIDSIDNSQQKITTPKKILGSEAPSRARQIVNSGDILFSTVRTYLKNIAFVEEQYDNQIASTGFCIIRPKKGVDGKFIFNYVQTQNFLKKLELLQRGANYPAVRESDVLSQQIPLPPFQIQRKIVAVLEQAEAVKRQRQEADALTGALLQSVFYEMFGDMVTNERGWDIIEFGDIICETKNGLYKIEKFQGKGTPILRMYNIYKNRIVLDKYHLITITDDEFEQYQVKPGDILFNRVNSPIWLGKSAVIPKDIGKFVFESKNIRIRVDTSKADPEYIVWYLSTPAGREEISKRAKAAVNQSTVNNTDLREFRILLPPLALQQQFAQIVQDVERVREQQVASGKEIEGLCEGLMARAFTGQLA